jgi:pimeloyl-ACP methyl ester carboxylesterase
LLVISDDLANEHQAGAPAMPVARCKIVHADPGRDGVLGHAGRARRESQRGCATIDIPVQILWGEQDGWIPAEHGRRLAKLIPGAGFELTGGQANRTPR